MRCRPVATGRPGIRLRQPVEPATFSKSLAVSSKGQRLTFVFTTRSTIDAVSRNIFSSRFQRANLTMRDAPASLHSTRSKQSCYALPFSHLPDVMSQPTGDSGVLSVSSDCRRTFISTMRSDSPAIYTRFSLPIYFLTLVQILFTVTSLSDFARSILRLLFTIYL